MASLISYFYRVAPRTGFVDLDDRLLDAAGNGNARTVKALLDAGADVHAFGDEALCMAAVKGHAEVIRVLLAAGADVHAGDDDGLCVAAGNGYSDASMVLLEGGADVNACARRRPVWLAACDDADTARLLHDWIAREENKPPAPAWSNTPGIH